MQAPVLSPSTNYLDLVPSFSANSKLCFCVLRVTELQYDSTMSICLHHVSELMPRQTNFDRFKLHTDRSVVNELKTELWNTKAVSDLQNPNHLFSIPSRFFAKHDSDDLSDSDCEPVHSFVNKCLQSHCHKSRPASEDVAIKLQLLEEKLSESRFEVSLSKMSIHFYGL